MSRLRSLVASQCLIDPDTVVVTPIFEGSEITVQTSGRPREPVEVVDSFLLIRPRNHLLRSFYDMVYSPSRHNHVVLDEPFRIVMDWHIQIPEGYTLHNPPEGRNVAGPAKLAARISYKHENNVLSVNALVNFPQIAIPHESYKQFIEALDNITKTVEKEIVLRKL